MGVDRRKHEEKAELCGIILKTPPDAKTVTWAKIHCNKNRAAVFS